MNISVPKISNQYFYGYKNNRNNIQFGSKSEKNETKNNSFFRKVLPYTVAGILMSGCTLKSCTSDTVSGTDNYDNIRVEYFDVDKETKDSIMTPIINLRSKLDKNNDFLNGIAIDVTGNYSDLDDSNSFRKYIKADSDTDTDKGGSFYSDNNLQRRIVIQESGHSFDKILNLIRNGKYSATPALRQSLMHEVGHQFEQYFGHDHNADFAKEWDDIMLKREKDEYLTPYEMPTDSNEVISKLYYNLKSGLSDKKEFQDAILKDLKYIAKLKQNNPEKLSRNIDYYLNIIDVSQEITPAVIDYADMTRSEVYANLFSYAVGENDGDKDEFLDNFKNSYKIVRSDIEKYLGNVVLK